MEIIFCGKSINLQNLQNVTCTKIYPPNKKLASPPSAEYILILSHHMEHTNKSEFGFERYFIMACCISNTTKAMHGRAYFRNTKASEDWILG